MSLTIDVDEVTGVLLAGGWHTVAPGSLTIDALHLVESGIPGATVAQMHDMDPNREPMRVHDDESGFSFQSDDGSWVSGPVAAILAFRHLR
jgi:hypothetical protein